MNIRVKKLLDEAIVPSYAYEDDAGCDIYSAEDKVIKPGERIQLRTGLAFEIPTGYVALLWDKSGLSHRQGIKTMGGVIDSGYRGELLVGLINLSDIEYEFKKGHKVCQMVIQEKVTATFEEVDELTESHRGEGGFGSSGK